MVRDPSGQGGRHANGQQAQRIEVIDGDECRRLLAEDVIGRVAVVIGATPMILPVNYKLDGEDIVLEASELVHSLRCAPLLTGYRGAEPVDVDAVADLLVRLSLLTRDVPEIRELDLNPVMASGDRVVTVDARVRVAPVAAGPIPIRTMLRQLSPAIGRRERHGTRPQRPGGARTRRVHRAPRWRHLRPQSPLPPTRFRSCCR